MTSLVGDPALLRWLLGQCVALVVAGLWIWTLRRQLRDSTRRNEHLSDVLLRIAETDSREHSLSGVEKRMQRLLRARARDTQDDES